MGYRFLAISGVLAVILALPLAGQSPHAAKAKSSAIPRAADGHPDLQGVWTNATVTPMQRPPALSGKATLTDAEAREFEKKQAEELQSVDGKSESPLLAAAGSNGTGGYNVLFIDRGSELARVDGVKRTSLIIDPPDGKMPPITAEARQRNGVQTEACAQIDRAGAGLRRQRQRAEFGLAAREGGVDVADHPCVDRTQVIGVMVCRRFDGGVLGRAPGVRLNYVPYDFSAITSVVPPRAVLGMEVS